MMPADRPSPRSRSRNRNRNRNRSPFTMAVEGSTFTWEIQNFSKQQTVVVPSHPFAINGQKWCLRLYPLGTRGNHAYLSVFLSVADLDSLPDGWSRMARFSVVLINQLDKARSVCRDAEHKFHAGSSAWGWESFLHLNQLHNNSSGFLVNDTFIIKADFSGIIRDQKKEELNLTIKEGLKEHAVVVAGDEYHKEGKGEEETRQGKEPETLAIQREGDTEKVTLTSNDSDKDSRKETCLNMERDCVEEEEDEEKEEESEAKGRNIEKLKKFRQMWLTMTKRRKIEDEAMNLTGPQSPKPVLPIGFPKVEALAASKSNSLDQSQTALENFEDLFEDISRVLGASSSSAITTREADASIEAVEISLSLSLLKQVADKSFCQIPSSLWPELSKALDVLTQAKSLPSPQFSAITKFSKQFGSLCRSHDSNFAVLDITQQFLNTKYETFLSLKRLNKSQLEIKNSLDTIRKEKDMLSIRFMELNDSEFVLLEDYNIVGMKAKGVKAEWDELIKKDTDMVGQIEKAENALAAIETDWSRFISPFK